MSVDVNIEVLRGNPDTARVYKWDVKLSGAGPGSLETPVKMRCSTLTTPAPSYNIVSVDIRGFSKKETGMVDWGSVDFTVIEMDDYSNLAGLWAWSEKQYNHITGVHMTKSAYEGTCEMKLLNVGDSPVKTWKLTGCVLSNLSGISLGSDKSGTQDISFTLEFDYAEVV